MTKEKTKTVLKPEELNQLAAFAKEQAGKVAKQVPVMGAVAWLMMQGAATRHTLLSDLQWRVMPPLILDQAKLFMRDGLPLAYVSWALLSESAAERYQHPPHQLAASDWQSGNQVWIIDLLAPHGGADDVVKDLREKEFSGKAIYQLLTETSQAVQVVNWGA